MIWSFSNSRAFDRCQRSWFYDNIFGNGVAKDENRHEMYLLSKLQTISAWRGSIVDKAIETSLVPALKSGRTGNLPQCVARARQLFNAQAHLHLSAKRGRDPFEVPRLVQTSHPPDAARMEAVLRALASIGFQAEAGQVQERWQQFLTAAGFRAEPEYRRCFPTTLLDKVCKAAIQGVTAGNCRIARPTTSDAIFVLLNDAWREFWRAPDSYDTWELQAIEELRKAA